MDLDAAAVLEQAGRFAHLLEGEAVAERFEDLPLERRIRVASDQEVLRSLAEVTRLIRFAEAQRITLAGEIARRSDPGDDAPLAKRSGATGPADLVAQVAGVRRQEAGALVSDVEGTVSASAVRKLASEAEIIPVVLGGSSRPLDLGESRRFFTEAQRRAMAARDHGCAGPNCSAPLSWTQAAHIRPAGRGRTLIDNGISRKYAPLPWVA